MTKHLRSDLENLKRRILAMGALVEEATNLAISSLVHRRPELAEQVLLGDDAIDRMELDVEDTCLKVLALHQPVASDLRFIVAVMKVNNDLERMGDHAQNIAKRSSDLASQAPLDVDLEFGDMMEAVRRMVSRSLDALVRGDTDIAREVIASDDEVDRMHRQMFADLEDLMRRDPDSVSRAVLTLSVARHLERIADLATNIAEDIVFMVEGEVIRHRRARFAGDLRNPG